MNPQQAKSPPTYAFLRPYFQPCLSQNLQSFEGLAEFTGVNTTLAMEPVQSRRALNPTAPPGHNVVVLSEQRSPLSACRLFNQQGDES